MKKVLLTLALVFLGLVFPVLFLMVGSCAAESVRAPRDDQSRHHRCPAGLDRGES